MIAHSNYFLSFSRHVPNRTDIFRGESSKKKQQSIIKYRTEHMKYADNIDVALFVVQKQARTHSQLIGEISGGQ
jgi:hypothetical protein